MRTWSRCRWRKSSSPAPERGCCNFETTTAVKPPRGRAGMIATLLRKELRQHTGLFVLLGCVLFFGLILVSSNAVLSRSLGSGFAGLKVLLYTLLPAGAMLLGNALIASEFRHKTQLFLEGLPVPRWKLLAVKYATLLGALLLVTVVLLAGAWLGGRQSE